MSKSEFVDPLSWLVVSPDLRTKLNSRPYDARKSCWIPDTTNGGYMEATILSKDVGDKITVKIHESNETKVIKNESVNQVNPPKYDGIEDMTSMTYLNDACVLWNSVVRYKYELIYTYSGLFCIAINPYKKFPIYDKDIMDMYAGRRRNECPPHVFGVAEASYQSMMKNDKHQSILITGESGAGKTENTKKVIAYFAAAVGTSKKKSAKQRESKVGLESKIVQTNPVLEAWGNAKTVKNDNSSRFGKFIRIWFNQGGKLTGADIVTYLLEKSRLTFQTCNERNFHSFYNIMSGAVDGCKTDCFLTESVNDYIWISQGKTSVDSINDYDDMNAVDEAFEILGFSAEEKKNIYRLTAAVIHLGNMSADFVPIGKDEQADIKNYSNAQKVASLCGIDCEWMTCYFCKPKFRVGSEFVSRSQTCVAASSSVAAIGRKIYELIFKFIVEKCNKMLSDSAAMQQKIRYIGCLDIAGFEIFDVNGFEQICINFCNEKLQQFFNEYMFVLEQEEYIKEGIDWTNIDFGMDLSKCINMYEKPIGFLAILEEESLFPKATDATFIEKLNKNLLGKHETFLKPASKTHPGAHFAVVHYAGIVNYTVNDWLVKNKDPINETIIELMKKGSNNLLVRCLQEQIDVVTGSKNKCGAGKTVSSFYKNQLDELMSMLHATDPAFIRCIVPNTLKVPGSVDCELIMQQYRCNGVLAGLSICRKGFPNKITYKEFLIRYSVIAASCAAKAKRDKTAVSTIIQETGLNCENYRLGHTKIFLRTGVLCQIEELRDNKIGTVLTCLQSQVRGKSSRVAYKQMKAKILAIKCVQKTLRNNIIGKNWLWWQLWLAVRPKLNSSKYNASVRTLREKLYRIETNAAKVNLNRQTLEKVNKKLKNLMNNLVKQVKQSEIFLRTAQDNANLCEKNAFEIKRQLNSTLNHLKEEMELKEKISLAKDRNMKDFIMIQQEKKEVETRLTSIQQDVEETNARIRMVQQNSSDQNDLICRLSKEKKILMQDYQSLEYNIQASEDKSVHLSHIKTKLEQRLDEIEDLLEHEKKRVAEIEKSNKRIENDIRLGLLGIMSEMESQKTELNNSLLRKEKELCNLNMQIEDESTMGIKFHKQARELQNRIEELEEEIMAEKANGSKVCKSIMIIKKDLDDICVLIEESGVNTSVQLEQNKKKELELHRIKNELNEVCIQYESNLSAVRTKHKKILVEHAEQIQFLSSNNAKFERERVHLDGVLNNAKKELEDNLRSKNEKDKQGKQISMNIVESQNKLCELGRIINEADSNKKRQEIEFMDIERRIEEGEGLICTLNKNIISLKTRLDNAKSIEDVETRDNSVILSKITGLSGKINEIKEHIEEEQSAKTDVRRLLSKAMADGQLWKTKFETEGLGRVEELSASKIKLNARILEADEKIESLTNVLSSSEKTKARLQIELEEMSTEYEKTRAITNINEKRIRQFDQIIDEWKCKANDISLEIEICHKENRNYSGEMCHLSAALEDVVDQIGHVKRENRNLACEIKDLIEQQSQGNRSIHEMDKQRRQIEIDKESLQSLMEESEGCLEHEENKLLRIEHELSLAKQEMARKLQDKEEEFKNTKNIHERAVESLEASLEGEQKSKMEILKMKKKLESRLNELEIALDHANRVNVEGNKTVKKHQYNYRQLVQEYHDEQSKRNAICEEINAIERKTGSLSFELDEITGLHQTTERNQSISQRELEEARNALDEMFKINSMLLQEKRNIDGEVHALKADYESEINSAKNFEEKTKKAFVDAARLADELRAEQDHSSIETQGIRSCENQIVELERNIGEARDCATRTGINTLAKLEGRIRDLEEALGKMQSRTFETVKGYQRAERRIKELVFQQDEDKANTSKMASLATKLQNKIGILKRQIEETEEIAALNLAKFRKSQQELEASNEKTTSQLMSMRKNEEISMILFKKQ